MDSTPRWEKLAWRGGLCGLGGFLALAVAQDAVPESWDEWISAAPGIGVFMLAGAFLFAYGANYGRDQEIEAQQRRAETEEYEQILRAERKAKEKAERKAKKKAGRKDAAE